MKLRTGWLLLFVALLTGCASTAATDSTWNTSGFIEAEEVLIAPEIAGRVQQLLVDEGDEVHAGDVLLHLDGDILSAQVDLARGKLEEAQAMLAKAKAGARREAIVKAEAQLALAQAARAAAQQAWLDAQAMRDNPQTLDLQIAAARAQVTARQKQLDAALLQRDIAEQAWKDYGEVADKLAGVPAPYRPHLPTTYYDVPYQWEQAKAAVEA
ncbi:MAG TPA: biotin/lipoyl-binding protein, partial [Anaerolineae bacterium]